MIDTRNIEPALENEEVDEVQRLFEKLKKDYEGYKKTIHGLEKLDDKLASLSNKLTDGEIDAETFRVARKVLNIRNTSREQAGKLRREDIFHDYEKPL